MRNQQELPGMILTSFAVARTVSGPVLADRGVRNTVDADIIIAMIIVPHFIRVHRGPSVAASIGGISGSLHAGDGQTQTGQVMMIHHKPVRAAITVDDGMDGGEG